MSFGNFLYQVEGIGALPDASLYTDKYWCVLTGNSQYQGATYKSDGSNWVYVNGCITYGPGTPDVSLYPVGALWLYNGIVWQSNGVTWDIKIPAPIYIDGLSITDEFGSDILFDVNVLLLVNGSSVILTDSSGKILTK